MRHDELLIKFRAGELTKAEDILATFRRHLYEGEQAAWQRGDTAALTAMILGEALLAAISARRM